VLVLLGREPEAIADFERYLVEGDKEITDERREQVKTDLAKLKLRIAKIVLENAPDGLDVRLDGRAIGKTPLKAPIEVGGGKHTIALLRGPNVVFTKDLEIPARETMNVRVEIAPEPVKPPPPPTEDELGLIHPAFPLALSLGIAAPMQNVTRGRLDLLGAIDVSGMWRWHPIWSIGLFLGGAAGNVELPSGTANDNLIAQKATYSYGIGGLRARLHLLRDRYYDGWLGVDFGVWRETWKFSAPDDNPDVGGFEWAATSPAFGIAGGIDFPLAKEWAVGGGVRIFGTVVRSGDRVSCTALRKNCDDATLPGGGGQGGRGFLEVTARLTYSFAYGAH
jgi:hypothetical protein